MKESENTDYIEVPILIIFKVRRRAE